IVVRAFAAEEVELENAARRASRWEQLRESRDANLHILRPLRVHNRVGPHVERGTVVGNAGDISAARPDTQNRPDQDGRTEWLLGAAPPANVQPCGGVPLADGAVGLNEEQQSIPR